MKIGCLAYQLANNHLPNLDYFLTRNDELRNRGNYDKGDTE
jgi:hypothetical protein